MTAHRRQVSAPHLLLCDVSSDLPPTAHTEHVPVSSDRKDKTSLHAENGSNQTADNC